MLYYIVVINIVGLIIMGIDKFKAKHQHYRVSEKMLFTISLLGGGLGTWLGMYVFHHKTKHWYFVIGLPCILMIQLIGIYFIFDKI